MTRLTTLALLLLLICLSGDRLAAQTTVKPAPYRYTQLGCYQITSLTSAVGFPTIPSGTTLVMITVEGQPVRMRDDGTAPTSSVGAYLPVGGPWPYSGYSLGQVQFIQTASSATIDYCAYF